MEDNRTNRQADLGCILSGLIILTLISKLAQPFSLVFSGARPGDIIITSLFSLCTIVCMFGMIRKKPWGVRGFFTVTILAIAINAALYRMEYISEQMFNDLGVLLIWVLALAIKDNGQSGWSIIMHGDDPVNQPRPITPSPSPVVQPRTVQPGISAPIPQVPPTIQPRPLPPRPHTSDNGSSTFWQWMIAFLLCVVIAMTCAYVYIKVIKPQYMDSDSLRYEQPAEDSNYEDEGMEQEDQLQEEPTAPEDENTLIDEGTQSMTGDDFFPSAPTPESEQSEPRQEVQPNTSESDNSNGYDPNAEADRILGQ